MTVNLSIKNVPDEVVERLRTRAKRHHRSLQGELLAVLEETIEPKLTVEEAYERINALALQTDDDSTEFIRQERDAR